MQFPVPDTLQVVLFYGVKGLATILIIGGVLGLVWLYWAASGWLVELIDGAMRNRSGDNQ